MGNKLASIVVLTYKNFSKINENLTSIINQTYDQIEIIINDDCSENFPIDYINKILDKKKGNIKNVIINTHKKNLGTVTNFNDAIIKSSGDIIIPLSGDDSFADKNVVKDIIDEFTKSKFLVITAKRKIYLNGNEITLPNEEEIVKFESNPDTFVRELIWGNFISGACTYYDRSVFDKIGLFDERYRLIEDYPFYVKALMNGIKIGFWDRISIKYSFDGTSNQKIPNKQYINDLYKILIDISFDYKDKLSIFHRRMLKNNAYMIKNYGKEIKKNLIRLRYFEVNLLKVIRKVKKNV